MGLRAAVMDMNTAHDPEVRMHCPQAEIVYDLFHVVAEYGRELIDRVRVDEANRLRGDR
jgi:transposase